MTYSTFLSAPTAVQELQQFTWDAKLCQQATAHFLALGFILKETISATALQPCQESSDETMVPPQRCGDGHLL